MSTTFTWRVIGMSVSHDPHPYHVRVVQWEVIGDDGQAVVPMVNRTMIFPSPDSKFIPYDEITPELALSWVYGTLGSVGIARVKAMVQYSIDCSKQPTGANSLYYTPLPWDTGNV
jgi:hypothetical protein